MLNIAKYSLIYQQFDFPINQNKNISLHITTFKNPTYQLEYIQRILQGQLIINLMTKLLFHLNCNWDWFNDFMSSCFIQETHVFLNPCDNIFIGKTLAKISPTLPNYARNVNYSNHNVNIMGIFHQKYLTFILEMNCVWTSLLLGLFQQQIKIHPSVYWP